MKEIIGLKEVRHVAALARIRITDEEAERCRHELGGILGYIEKLNELDTSGIEPMSHVSHAGTPMREDEPATGNGVGDDLLGNAPERERNWFRVPQVIE